MALRKAEDAGNRKMKHWIELYGELDLEGVLELSLDYELRYCREIYEICTRK
jgi:hypothetical protein